MRPTSPGTTLARSLALALLALAACVAHDKAGDKAAALGDWKSAYLEYRQAVEDDAKDPAMAQKLAEARGKALSQATAKARACAAQRDPFCALGEADFALGIDPSSAELVQVRREAAQAVALDRIRGAEDSIARNALPAARDLLAEARRLSREPEVTEAAGRAEQRWVGAALAEAERLRAARRYPEALALAQGAAELDPSARREVDRIGREFEAFKVAEHGRLVAEGEAALAQNAWAEAGARFHAAQALLPDERTRVLERYCGLVAAGDQAVDRSDFRAASQRYGEAVELRIERSGYAAAQLARVQVRPYAIRLRSVLVDPLRGDGVPWLGTRSPRLDRLSRELSRGFDGIPFALLNQIPREHLPTLLVEVTLPDGRRLLTPTRRGVYVSFDSSVVVYANSFDRRRLVIQVLHQEPGGVSEQVGGVELGVGELVARAAAQLRSPPVLALELSVEPADGAPEGAATGFTDPEPPRQLPPKAPPPGPKPPGR